MNKSLQTLIMSCQFTMLLAMEMSNPFLPLFIASQPDITMQSAMIFNALAFSLPMIANIIMGPMWGRMADRYGYKPMLMRAAWALVLTQLLMAFATNVSTILIIRLLQGGFAGFIAAMQTYALSLCSWYEKTRQLARLQSAKAVATSCAGISGGLLLGFVNFQKLFLITSLLCFLTTLVMQHYLPTNPYRNLIKLSRKQVTAAYFSPFFVLIAALITLAQMAKFIPEPVFSLYMTHMLYEKPWVIGLMYSLPAAGIILTSGWCSRQFDRCRGNIIRVRNYFRNYLILAIVLMLAHIFIQAPALLALVRLTWGIVLAAMLPALFTIISDYSSEQGYLLGFANSCAKLGNLAGVLLGGWLAGILPLNFVFLIMAAIYLLMLIISTIFNPQVIQQPKTSLESFG